jgi:hypothetical protein
VHIRSEPLHSYEKVKGKGVKGRVGLKEQKKNDVMK